tara:strand:+ start:98 stop:1018 length:921 start_codon:yes stop_codon:yes gene_type:complete
MLGNSKPLNKANYSRAYADIAQTSPDSVASPRNIHDLIAWYDFVDRTTQWQETSSFTTQVTSNSDPIGRIKNKATGSNRLGDFLRASFNGDRPLWQNGYAKFDGSSDSLYGYGSSTAYGAVPGNNNGYFSDAIIDPHNISAFVIVNSDSATVSSDEIVFAISGTATNDSEENIGIALKHEAGSDDPELVIDYESETNDELQFTTGMPSSVKLLYTITGAGTNNTLFYRNNSADGSGTIANTGSRILNFTHNKHGFCIGEAITGSTGQVGALHYDGAIGEVIIYNRAINARELDIVKAYFNAKYSLW